jgi:proline iminopeptidase
VAERRKRETFRSILIGGGISCLVAVVFFLVTTTLGADRPFILRVVSAPIFVPFLLSKPFWEILWPSEIYIYHIAAFSLVFYFLCGGLIGLAYSRMERRKFMIGCILLAVIFMAVPTGLYLYDLPRAPQVNDYHRLDYQDIAMPLWVRGNIDSGVIILQLHGGPGDSAIRLSIHPAYRELESSYAVAYWDQPGAGNSRWLGPRRELSMSDVTDALDEVITYLHEQYPNTQLVLLGHSTGGEVGTKYLTEYPYEGRVAGWIELDGAHNEPRNWGLALDWLEQQANASLEENSFDSPEEKEFWQAALDYTAAHRSFEKWYDTALWDDYIGQAGGYNHSPETDAIMEGIPHYLIGRANFFLERVNLWHAKSVYLDALETDYTPVMDRITLPTLILWGRYDGAVSVELAQETYESIGTPDAQKEVVIFEQSGHNAMLEEPDKFVQAVETFIGELIAQ